MSFFFDDTKVYVDALATKLTDNITTPLRDGVLSGVMRNTGVGDGVLAATLNGLGARSRKYYKYGEREDYIDGLPTVDIGTEPNTVLGAGTYSPLDGEFFPIASLRRNQVFINDDPTSERALTTKRLLKRIALNSDDLIDSLQEEQLDENGDPIEGNPSEDLDDVFFLFGLDIFSLEEESAVYAYNFWENIALVAEIDEAQHILNRADMVDAGGSYVGLPSNSIRWEEGEDNFQIKLRFDYIEESSAAGTLVDGDGNAVKATMEVVKDIMETIVTDIGDGGGGYYEVKIDHSYLEIKKQNEGNIDNIKVYGFSHETLVDAYSETNGVLRTLNELSDDYKDLVPGDADFGRSCFYMPIQKDILDLQTPIPREEVLSDAMLLVMHAAQEVDLKWYQQTWFKIILVIAMAVITYFSVGLSGFNVAMSSSEFLMTVFTQYAIAYLLELVFKTVDGDFALIIGTAIALYALSKGGVSKASSLTPRAEQLLKATKAITLVTDAKIKNDTAELEERYDELEQRQEEHNEQMKEVYDLIGTNKFDPTWLSSEGNKFFSEESPSAFIERTKEIKNMASIVKDSIGMYHARAKKLPDTLEQNTLNSRTA